MKIHYLSCHSVLEYDEVKLLTELGHDVFSNGAYLDPKGHYSLPRPGIEGAIYHEDLVPFATQYPKTQLPPELIDPFDLFIIMSGENEQVLIQNWDKIKHKRVILRTIGQSTPVTEAATARMRSEGLQIVRYSPKEASYENSQGGDTLIRFYKDPEEFKGWTGEDKTVVNFSQSLKGRRDFLHYDEVMGAMVGFNAKVYGAGNNDLGSFNGGEIPYEMMKEIMRKTRVLVYSGTWPACYTLTIIEALMTGTPVVAIGKGLAHGGRMGALDYYEVDEFIKHGVNGYICNTVSKFRSTIEHLLANKQDAAKISKNARESAIELFGKEKIAKQWTEFLSRG